jgi:hypothetical protein
VTAGEFREVDLDLLADYVGGALDGTPEELVVARLVAEEPDWSRAYTELLGGVDRVRDELASWAAVEPTMPDEVLAHLTAVLATAALPGKDGTGSEVRPALPAQSGSTATPAETGTSARVVPEGSGDVTRVPVSRPARRKDPGRPAGPGPARRRSTRTARALLVAAAVLGLAGLGVAQLVPDRSGDGGPTVAATTEAAPVGSEAAAASESPINVLSGEPSPSPARILASGTAYTVDGLAAQVQAVAVAPNVTTWDGGDVSGQAERALPVPQRLARLADDAALAACLTAVTTAHGRGMLVVDFVDYASFDRSPAMVVVFTDPAGERWVRVVGPECGPAGPDDRYQLRIG